MAERSLNIKDVDIGLLCRENDISREQVRLALGDEPSSEDECGATNFDEALAVVTATRCGSFAHRFAVLKALSFCTTLPRAFTLWLDIEPGAIEESLVETKILELCSTKAEFLEAFKHAQSGSGHALNILRKLAEFYRKELT